MKRSDITDEHVLELARAWQRREGVPTLDALIAEGVPRKVAEAKIEHLHARGLLEIGVSVRCAWPAAPDPAAPPRLIDPAAEPPTWLEAHTAAPRSVTARVLDEIQRDTAERVGHRLAAEAVRAEFEAVVARFPPLWRRAWEVVGYSVAVDGDRYTIEVRSKNGHTETRVFTLAEARSIVDDAKRRLDRAVRGPLAASAAPARGLVRRELEALYGPRDREDLELTPYLRTDPEVRD